MAQCSTFEECCDLCGVDSTRCARGPCSQLYLINEFFSFSMPLEDIGFWDVVFSFYGMVPYLFIIGVALEFLFHRHNWSRIILMLFIGIETGINGIIGIALGDCSTCDRPCGNCLGSHGMPSGHSMNSISVTTLCLLELYRGHLRYLPMTKKIIIASIAILLLVPVPYGRVYLGDHDSIQVIIGSADGIVFAFLFFIVLHKWLVNVLDWITEKLTKLSRGYIVIENDLKIESKLPVTVHDRLLEADADNTSKYDKDSSTEECPWTEEDTTVKTT